MSDNKVKDICTGALGASAVILTTVAIVTPNPVTISSAATSIAATAVTSIDKKK